MVNATHPSLELLDIAKDRGVPVYPASVVDQQAMARTGTLCLLTLGPAHVEVHLHPAAEPEERVLILDAVDLALRDPARFDGAWTPAADDGWELWLQVAWEAVA